MASASPSADEVRFNGNYQTHLKHLKLKGLQPKTSRSLLPRHPADGRLFRVPD